MSWLPAQEPRCEAGAGTALDLVIVPRQRDLGGLQVRRVLPASERRMVGPFVFLDQMGPVAFKPGAGLDVRPHPHIGLATVTYLFEGEILHRDSLGSVQPIRPGEVNWMTAGRGITHSERTPETLRMAPSRLFGVQAWIALPKAQEQSAPSFAHHDTKALPVVETDGARVRVMAGSFGGQRSPVKTVSEMIYADATLRAGGKLSFSIEYEERGIYIVDGMVDLGGRSFGTSQLLVFRRGVDVKVTAPAGAHLLLLGGAPLDGPRHIWWNFVSSSKDSIEKAKADWKAGNFASVPGETEFIPLPE